MKTDQHEKINKLKFFFIKLEINEISLSPSVAQFSVSGAFKFHCHSKIVAVDEAVKWNPNCEIPSLKQITLFIIQLVVTGNQDPERRLNIIHNENHESINYLLNISSSSKLCF